MKVLNLCGNSIDTVEKMKNIARLLKDGTSQFVVLSAASTVSKHLDEIAANLFNREIERAHGQITKLEFQFIDFANSLLEDEILKQNAINYIIERFQYIWKFTKNSFTAADEKDIMAQGELITSALLNSYLREQGVKSVFISAFDFMRINLDEKPDYEYLEKRVNETLQINSDADLFITQGQLCKNCYDETAYMKAGGTEYTSALIAKALHAEEILIWKELSTDTKEAGEAKDARYTKNLNYNEAERLSHFNVEIVSPLCLCAAQEENIPIHLYNPLDLSDKGILISDYQDETTVKAVASKDSILYIKFESNNTLRPYLFISKIFDIFAKYQTSPCLLTSSSNNISIATDNKGYLSSILRELNRYAKIWVEDRMTIVSIIGNLKWQQPGAEARVMEALKDVPLRMIAYGSNYTDISMVIKASDKKKAMQALNGVVEW